MNPIGESFAKDKWFRWVHNILLILSCGMVFYSLLSNTFLPLQDYPQWLFHGKVLHQYFLGDPDWSIYYKVVWVPLPPNILVTLVIALLQFFVSIYTAGKLILIFYIILLISGWYYLFTVHDAIHPLRWMGIIFVQNHFFFMGFLSYLLGFSLLMFAVGWLSSQKSYMSWRTAFGFFIISMMLFATHVVAIGLFGIAVAIAFIFEYNHSKTIAWKVLLSIVPLFFLVLFYLTNAPSGNEIKYYPSLWAQFSSWRYAIHIFNRLLPFVQQIPLSFLNVLIEVFVLYLCVMSFKKKTIAQHIPLLMVLAIVSFALTVFLPFSQIGEFGDINKRFVLPAVVFFFASQQWKSKHRYIELSIIALGLLTATMHQLQMVSFDKEVKQINADIHDQIRTRDHYIVISRGFVDEYDKRPSQIYSGIIRPMLHFQWYCYLDHPTRVAQLFETGLVQQRFNSIDTSLFDSEKIFCEVTASGQAIAPLRSWLARSESGRYAIILFGTPSSLSVLQSVFPQAYIQKPLSSGYANIFIPKYDAKKDTSSYIKQVNILQ
jgi:hypothetical protein